MKLKSKKSALLLSFTSLLLCFAMLAGSTFAWVTDTATTGVNRIQSGTLDVDIVDATDTTKSLDKQTLKWVRAKSGTEEKDVVDSAEILWEPGCTYQLQSFRIANKGNLALKYKIQITGIQGDAKLNKVIEWKINGEDINLTEKHLLAGTANNPTYSDAITISGHMKEKAGNEYQNLTIDGIAITVYATQLNSENDSFGPDYDKDATYYPVLDAAGLKDALVNGGEIQVVEDVNTSREDTVAARMIVSKPTTLQLDKKIISPDNMGNNKKNFTALIVDADTTINAGPEGGIDTGTNGGYAINVRNGATLTINSGDYYGGGTAVQVQEGELIINGGFFAVEPYSDARYGYNFLLNCIDSAYKNGSAKIIVKGGTFVNFDPSNNTAEGAGTNFVADGYGVVATPQANGDVWYTVVKKSADGETFGSGTHTLSTGITATNANAVAVKAESGANITITGGAYDGGKGGNNVCVWADTGSTVTIKDGTFTVGGDADENGNSVIYSTGGDITIEGGFFYTNYSYRDKYYVLNQQNNNPGTITVKGGTFVNYNPAGGDDYVQPTNFVADGYKVVTETHGEDTWYTVVAE